MERELARHVGCGMVAHGPARAGAGIDIDAKSNEVRRTKRDWDLF